jgi:hypothetical protein
MKYHNMRVGKISGILVPLLKLNTYFEGLVKGVFRLECAYKKNGLLVHWYVLFVTKKMKMIGMFYLLVKLVSMRVIMQVWIVQSCLGCNSVIMLKKQFSQFVQMKIRLQQVGLQSWHEFYGQTEITKFGMRLVNQDMC